MSNVLDKINSLIERALHKNTAMEESRTCAFVAIRLIRQHGLIVSEKIVTPGISTISASGYDYSHDPYMGNTKPIDINDFTEEIKPFNLVVSTSDGNCVACGHLYTKSSVVAESWDEQGTRAVAHFTCKRYFLGERV